MERLDKIIALRKHLHQIPEASMHEVQTKKVLMQFLKENTDCFVVDKGEWFYAVRRATSEPTQPPIAFRADMDAVCGADGKPGHYCGHDGHSSILCGVAMYLAEQNLSLTRDVYLIFQPAEEIGQGAKLCKTLICEKNIAEIYGLHNIPGYPLQQILVRKQTFACASTGLAIRMKGVPSHAAYPEAGRNPAIPFANLLSALGQLTDDIRKQNEFVLMTVIGMDIGSANYGVSASEGELRLTVRAERQHVFDAYLESIQRLVEQYACKGGFSYTIEEIERFPATENSQNGVERICDAAKKMNLKVSELEQPMRWSEDFGYYLQETTGAFFGIGDGKDHAQLHMAEYEFPDAIIETGIAMFVALI